jgi:hypothetical protein
MTEDDKKNVWVTADVRVMGASFAPSPDPYNVHEKIADEIVRVGCGSLENPAAGETAGKEKKQGLKLSLVGEKNQQEQE